MALTFKPRHDFVIVRVALKPNVGRLAISQRSPEAYQYFVEAIGPDVINLKVGDRVLVMGQIKEHWDYIPGMKAPDNSGLIQIKDSMVSTTIEGVEEVTPPEDMGVLCPGCRTQYTRKDQGLCDKCLGVGAPPYKGVEKNAR